VITQNLSWYRELCEEKPCKRIRERAAGHSIPHLLIVSYKHVLEINLHLDMHIRASSLLRSSTASIPKELAEHIKGIMMPSTSVPLLFMLLQAVMPVAVVDRPLVLVRQDFIRLRDCYELFFSVWC
jgi:hypothetical protein